MLLEDEPDMQVVGEAADGDEAVDLIGQLDPDILLLDLTMPRMSGLEVLKTLSRQSHRVYTLVFSMHSNPDYILKAVQHGAAGYLLKDTGQAEILKAIRTVVNGELYYPPSASNVIIKQLVRQQPVSAEADTQAAKTPTVWNRITPREAQVLNCLMDGMSSTEIATRFGVSVNTVANQRASIIRKAGVKNTADLIRLAVSDKRR